MKSKYYKKETLNKESFHVKEKIIKAVIPYKKPEKRTRNHGRVNYLDFERTIKQILDQKCIIWKFNSSNYSAFTKNEENYYDQAHLSQKGASFILEEIEKKLIENQ